MEKLNEEINSIEVEKEIFETIKEKIKNLNSKETDTIIETEIRKRNYIKEDWQITYAVERIKEKVSENIDYLNFKSTISNSKQRVTPIAPIIITIALFFIAILFYDNHSIFPIASLGFIASITFIIKQRREYNKFTEKIKQDNK